MRVKTVRFHHHHHRKYTSPVSAIAKTGELVHELDYSLKTARLQFHSSALGFKSLLPHGVWWPFPCGRFVARRFGCAGRSVFLIPSPQKHTFLWNAKILLKSTGTVNFQQLWKSGLDQAQWDQFFTARPRVGCPPQSCLLSLIQPIGPVRSPQPMFSGSHFYPHHRWSLILSILKPSKESFSERLISVAPVADTISKGRSESLCKKLFWWLTVPVYSV